MTPEQLEEIVDQAVGEGAAAYQAYCDKHGDVGACGSAAVHIPVDELHKPLIRALGECDIGRFDSFRCDYKVDAGFCAAYRPAPLFQSIAAREAGCEACAAVLRRAGFRPVLHSYLD